VLSFRHSRRQSAGPLPILLRAEALKTQVVVAIAADLAAMSEPRRPDLAGSAPPAVRRVRPMNDSLGRSKKLLLRR
jgi:hypothetical protein